MHYCSVKLFCYNRQLPTQEGSKLRIIEWIKIDSSDHRMD